MGGRGIWLVQKAEFWYCGGGHLTGALHVTELQLLPPPLPSSLAAARYRMVCHGTGLPRFSWKLAIKTSVVSVFIVVVV